MKRRWLATVTAAAMAASMAFGCLPAYADSTEAAAADADGDAMYDGKVLLGHSSWIGFVPLNVADDMGFFDAHGADVDIQSFESKADSRAALAAGQIQGISTTIDTQIMTAAAGIPIKVVLAEDTSSGGDGISAKSEITSFEDLKGHTVGLDTSGGASYFWFQYLLKQHNMTLDDVEVVNMSSGDAGAAFVAGQVDAAVTWEPWLSRAKEAEDGSVLMDSSETPGIIVDTLAMDSDFCEKYPGTVKAIIQGWYDALDYIKSNPDEAYKIMMKYTGDETVEALEGEMAGVSFYDQAGNEEYYKSDFKEIAQTASDLWLENGLIDSAPDIDALIDGSFLAGSGAAEGSTEAE